MRKVREYWRGGRLAWGEIRPPIKELCFWVSQAVSARSHNFLLSTFLSANIFPQPYCLLRINLKN